MGKRRMKGCSMSLTIIKMHIETTMRYHFTALRTARNNKSTNKRCW